MGYGLLLSVVLFISGCMEYSPPAPGTNTAKLLVQKREYSSKPKLKIQTLVTIDNMTLRGKKSVRLPLGKHSFSTRAFPIYNNNKFYGIEQFFSLNIKANARYIFYYRADRRVPKNAETPNIYFTVRENGKLILSRRMKTIGNAAAEADAQMMMTNIIMSALIF